MVGNSKSLQIIEVMHCYENRGQMSVWVYLGEFTGKHPADPSPDPDTLMTDEKAFRICGPAPTPELKSVATNLQRVFVELGFDANIECLADD